MREQRDPVCGERILFGQAKCGLPIRVVPRQKFSRACAHLTVDFGAVDRALPGPGRGRRLPAGVAHFLEHKMFEKARGDLFSEFSRLGSSANAMTGHTSTSYVFSCTDSFEENLDVLLDVVFDAYFTDELVQKEQGIIAEEIRGYDDSAGWRAYRALLEGMYHKHPVRDDIAGTERTIAQITADQLHAVHAAFYAPHNAVLCVAGNVDAAAVLRRVDARLGRVRRGQAPVRPPLPVEPAGIRRRRQNVRMPVGLPIFYLGFKGPVDELSGAEAFRLETATSIALELVLGETTEFHDQLYADGLIGEEFSWTTRSERGATYAIIGGQTPDPRALERRVLSEVENALDRPLDGVALERVKRRILGDYVRLLDSMEGLCGQLAECHRAGLDFFSLLPRVERMSVKTVLRQARRLLQLGRMASVAVLPPKQ
ncbi:MAG: hypothetical protein CMJ83_08795 [Planctomycetes bacterium]|nr:hypothetical protein [Planctomycetota bacterium]